MAFDLGAALACNRDTARKLRQILRAALHIRPTPTGLHACQAERDACTGMASARN
jgi:hypothetical protein